MTDDLKNKAISLMWCLREELCYEDEFDRRMTALLDSLPPDNRIPFAKAVIERWANEVQ
jgi:hypothetical protein